LEEALFYIFDQRRVFGSGSGVGGREEFNNGTGEPFALGDAVWATPVILHGESEVGPGEEGEGDSEFEFRLAECFEFLSAL
jgi:hypothetical protein